MVDGVLEANGGYLALLASPSVPPEYVAVISITPRTSIVVDRMGRITEVPSEWLRIERRLSPNWSPLALPKL